MMNKNHEHIEKNPDTMVYPLERKFNRKHETADIHKAVGNTYGNRDVVKLSEILQQRDYARCGYVSADTKDDQGRLPKELDAARGNHVVTMLATSKKYGGRRPSIEEAFESGSRDGIATMRLVYPQGEHVETLPSWNKVFSPYVEKGNPHPSAQDVRRYKDVYGAKSVVEVSSLASENNPAALFEVIRDAIQCQYTAERPEIWLAAIVEKPFRALESRLGSRFISKIGEPYGFGESDNSVEDDVRLVPAVIHVDQWPELMATEILDNATDNTKRDKMHQMLQFLLDGMPPENISPVVREALAHGGKNEAA